MKQFDTQVPQNFVTQFDRLTKTLNAKKKHKKFYRPNLRIDKSWDEGDLIEILDWTKRYPSPRDCRLSAQCGFS